jgi:hypothetical protein
MRDFLQIRTAERVRELAQQESCPSKRDGVKPRCSAYSTFSAFEPDPFDSTVAGNYPCLTVKD